MDVVMPQLGETVAEGTISAWFKTPGDAVEAGETLFEIETDKAAMEVQALSSGTLIEIRVRQGETAAVGAVVATIDRAGTVAIASAPADAPGETPPTPAPRAGIVAPVHIDNVRHGAPSRPITPFDEVHTPVEIYGKARHEGIRVTPLARRLIAQNGVDVAAIVAALGPGDLRRIGRTEVITALDRGLRQGMDTARPEPARPRVPASMGTVLPFNRIRRRTGQRLAESWRSVPHVLQAVEIDFSAVDRARRTHGTAFQTRHGISLHYLPFIARAVVIALGDFPSINARIEDEGLVLGTGLHLGIAVDLSHDGLVVPILHHAETLTVTGLAKAIADQVDKARTGRLMPDDLSGGTYTISNNGAFGTLFTAPIINPPQVAILSTDAVRKKPVVIESGDGDGLAIRPIGIVTQSFDHRAFDGAYAAAYLARLKAVLETRDWESELA